MNAIWLATTLALKDASENAWVVEKGRMVWGALDLDRLTLMLLLTLWPHAFFESSVTHVATINEMLFKLDIICPPFFIDDAS